MDISLPLYYSITMKIDLTPEQNEAVRHAVETGRVHEPEEAGRQAMALWVEREHKRAEFLASLDAAEASIARGEGGIITRELMRELAEDVKRLGREHILARNNTRP
jgi:Arc/MetJ-type ribon-helix-helix transcriptional regulator